MKITYSTQNINSFGGINFADSIIDNASVYKTIDPTLGQRGVKAGYSYSDLFRHAEGYFPGIASIGNFPVYIENRNGKEQKRQAGT